LEPARDHEFDIAVILGADMLAWRPLPWAAVMLLGATEPRAEQAREPSPRVRFELEAPPECPTEAEFIQNVRKKTVFDLETPEERASRTFSVALSRRPDDAAQSFRGELRVVTPRGPASTRVISGVNCAEVAEAIAVIIAIELGPEHRAEDEPAPPEPVRPPPPIEPLPAATGARWRWTVTAAFGVTSAVADALSPEARLMLALRNDSSELWSPEVRAGFVYVGGRTIENDAGSLQLTLLALAVEACPLRIRLSESLALVTCARSMLARRFASGGPPSNPSAESSTGWWADIAGVGRAELALSSATWVELMAEGFAPLVRDRFYTFSPGLTVFEPPSAGARAAFGMGLHFH
jgi:hypothetical protein